MSAWPKGYRVKREGGRWPWCQFRVDVKVWRDWTPIRWFLREGAAREWVRSFCKAEAVTGGGEGG